MSPAPTISYRIKDGKWVWVVTYCGMVRFHAQEWQARWMFEQAMNLYPRQES